MTVYHLLAGRESAARIGSHQHSDPSSGEPIGDILPEATAEEINEAVTAAVSAWEDDWPGDSAASAGLLHDVARRLERDGEAIVDVAHAETALGTARLRGELGRTVFQLRFQARCSLTARASRAEERDDTWAGTGRPRLERLPVSIGPVAVFAASNFPLAFSVAGGDAASAFAAGCPVVLKAHPGHPQTAQAIAGHVVDAVRHAGLHPGTFSLIHGATPEPGRLLASHPGVGAVAFTGSRAGGRSLYDAAAARPDPIPVYAEMGSVNPVLISPATLASDGEGLAQRLAASAVLGAGQFCTNPGVVLLPTGWPSDRFIEAFAACVRSAGSHPLLTEAIHGSYRSRIEELESDPRVDLVLAPRSAGPGRHEAHRVARITAEAFVEDERFREEVFGPFTLFVTVPPGAWRDVTASLDGQLTGTVLAAGTDPPEIHESALVLARKVGRLLGSGAPTGVAVSELMHHGGPWPATTAATTTSVGGAAIDRFLRPLVVQDGQLDRLVGRSTHPPGGQE
jgi:NADP-dependent aldehyde dehydrogenase